MIIVFGVLIFFVGISIEGLKAISEDKIDAFVYDAPFLRYLVHKEFQGELEVLRGTFVRQDYGIALTAGSPLRETINRLLLKKITEQAWQDLLHRSSDRRFWPRSGI